MYGSEYCYRGIEGDQSSRKLKGVGINATNPPQISDAGVTVGVDLILQQSLLDSLLADAKLLVPAALAAAHATPRSAGGAWIT